MSPERSTGTSESDARESERQEESLSPEQTLQQMEALISRLREQLVAQEERSKNESAVVEDASVFSQPDTSDRASESPEANQASPVEALQTVEVADMASLRSAMEQKIEYLTPHEKSVPSIETLLRVIRALCSITDEINTLDFNNDLNIRQIIDNVYTPVITSVALIETRELGLSQVHQEVAETCYFANLLQDRLATELKQRYAIQPVPVIAQKSRFDPDKYDLSGNSISTSTKELHNVVAFVLSRGVQKEGQMLRKPRVTVFQAIADAPQVKSRY